MKMFTRLTPLIVLCMLIVSMAAPAIAQNPLNGGNGNGNDVSKNPGTDNINLSSRDNSTLPPGQNKTKFSGADFKITIGTLKTPPKATQTPASVTTGNGKKPVPTATKTAVNDNQLRNEKKQAHAKIAVAINQLEVYAKRVSNSKLPAEEKALLQSQISENLAWYRQIDSDIQAATDLDQVRETSALVTGYTNSMKVDLKKDAGLLACESLLTKISTARDVSALASGKIAEKAANGADTAKMEQKLAEFDEHIAAAEQLVEAAGADFNAITTEQNAEQNFHKGYQKLQLAEVRLKQAYQDLKEIYLALLRV